MSNSLENKVPSSGDKPNQSNQPIPRPAQINLSKPKTEVKFSSANIDQWRANQGNPFEEQNKKDAERKQKNAALRKKILIPTIIIISLVLIGLLIWGIITWINSANPEPTPDPDIPTISGGTTDDIIDYRDKLQNFYNNRGESLEAVEDAVNATLDTEAGKENASAIKIAQMGFYAMNNYNEQTIATGDNLDVEQLSLNDKITYYSYLQKAYHGVNDKSKEEECSAILYDLLAQRYAEELSND